MWGYIITAWIVIGFLGTARCLKTEDDGFFYAMVETVAALFQGWIAIWVLLGIAIGPISYIAVRVIEFFDDDEEENFGQRPGE